MSQFSLAHRPISDVLRGNPLPRQAGRLLGAYEQPVQTKASQPFSDITPRASSLTRPLRRTVKRPLVKREYQAGRLVDVVYLPRHAAVPVQSKPVPVPSQAPTLAAQFESAGEPARSSWFKRYVPVGVASLVLMLGLSVFALTLVNNKQVVEQVAAEAQAGAEGAAGEAPPAEDEVSAAALSSYRVDPGQPRLVEIEKLGVQGRVMRLGLTRNGAMATPANVHDAGWYDSSSKPGEGGAVLLAAHVHGPTKPGIFYNLKKLEAGDIVKITRGDGQVFQYRVVSQEQVAADQVDMSKALLPVTPGKGGLNLITCAGTLKGTTYQDRIIVYTEQI